MITYLVLNAIIVLFGVSLSWLDPVDKLPWGLDDAFSNGMAYFHKLSSVFPPFTVFLNAVLLFMGYKLTMLVLKIILGSRTPKDA